MQGRKKSEFPFNRRFKYFNIWFCHMSGENKKFWKNFAWNMKKNLQLMWHYNASARSTTMPPGSRNFDDLSHRSSWSESFEETPAAVVFILMTRVMHQGLICVTRYIIWDAGPQIKRLISNWLFRLSSTNQNISSQTKPNWSTSFFPFFSWWKLDNIFTEMHTTG